jgi:hypothetical protein
VNIGETISGGVSGSLLLESGGVLAERSDLKMLADVLYAPAIDTGALFAHAPISWFGGGTQDRFKISCQTAGSGVVLLAISENGANYMPFQIRGQNVRLSYRIPDPNDPNGYSAVWADGLTLGEDGNVVVHNELRPAKAIRFYSDYAYFRGNPNHGFRWNNSDNTRTDMTLDDSGRLRVHGLAGTGKRALYVDANGVLCT